MIQYRGNTKTIVYQQAGVVPFRYLDGRLQIMLITSRKSRRWIIPKGLLEEGLSSSELAMKEAYEEAGISGNISNRSFGFFQYEKWSGMCVVEVFSLYVTNEMDQWPEDDFRFRQWFKANEVSEFIKNEELKLLIEKFVIEHQDITI